MNVSDMTPLDIMRLAILPAYYVLFVFGLLINVYLVRIVHCLAKREDARSAQERVDGLKDIQVAAAELERKAAALAADVRVEADARARESQARHDAIAAKLDTMLDATGQEQGHTADAMQHLTDEVHESARGLSKQIQEGTDNASAAYHEANSVNVKIEELNKRLLQQEEKPDSEA